MPVAGATQPREASADNNRIAIDDHFSNLLHLHVVCCLRQSAEFGSPPLLSRLCPYSKAWTKTRSETPSSRSWPRRTTYLSADIRQKFKAIEIHDFVPDCHKVTDKLLFESSLA